MTNAGQHSRDTSRPLNGAFKAACLTLLWLSLMPLLLGMPPALAVVASLAPGGASLLALRQPLPIWVRALLLVGTGMLIWIVQARWGDYRSALIACLVAAFLMKSTELTTVRAGYGIVGLVLFGPFLAFILDTGESWTMALGLVILMLALALAGALTEWQDRLSSRRWHSHLGEVGRLALLAVPLAAAAFWLLPRPSSPLWGLPSSGRAQTGIDANMAPGDLRQMLEDSATAFRVDFEGARPAPNGLYWRGLTLGTFDGRSWLPSLHSARGFSDNQLSIGANAPPPLRYTVSMEPTGQSYLFTLDPLADAPDNARRFQDNRLASLRPLRGFTRWAGLSAQPGARLDRNGLDVSERRAMLALPASFNPRTRALARAWRSEGKTDREVVQAALAFFRTQFSYSLEPPLLGRHSVDEFLFDTREGYCEHFSSAFAVLMRSAGLPTRIVIGYQGGLATSPTGLLVRQADAHAWNEVWLRGQGWVRVDPTAALAQERSPAPGQELSGFQRFGAGGGFDWLRRGWEGWFGGFDGERQRELLQALGLARIPPAWLGTMVAVALLAGMAAAGRWAFRVRLPRVPPELSAWLAWTQRLRRRGYAIRAHETPLGLLAHLTPHWPAETLHELQACVTSFCRWRYMDETSPGLASRIRALPAPKKPNEKAA